MQIIVNGKAHDMVSPLSVEALIETLDLNNKRYAVELNQHILPRSRYAETVLAEGDTIEIIHAVGGG